MKYYYCFNSKNELFKEEVDHAKKLGLLIIYDSKKDMFLDKDNNKIDIKDMLLLPRTTIKDSTNLLDAIVRHGGISLESKEDYYKILNWPYYINTKRKNIILSGREIISNPKFIINMFGNDKIILKTKNKNFSGVVDLTELLNNNSPIYLALNKHLDEDFILSANVNIEKDQEGLLEYRIFVIEGKIHNVSRINNNLTNNIPKELIIELENIISDIKKTDFPNSYVLDVIVYKDLFWKETFDILDCNPIISSRLKLTENLISYRFPGGFSSTLMSFYSYDYDYEPPKTSYTRKLLNDNYCSKR